MWKKELKEAEEQKKARDKRVLYVEGDELLRTYIATTSSGSLILAGLVRILLLAVEPATLDCATFFCSYSSPFLLWNRTVE